MEVMLPFLLTILLMCCSSNSGARTAPDVPDQLNRIRRSTDGIVSFFQYLFEGLEKRVAEQEEINEELQRRMASLSEQREIPIGKAAATYVRWGRNDCPGNGTSLIYEGYAAGSHYTHGGGANYLCLPRNPTWKKYQDGHQGGAYVYGSEYEFENARSNKFFQTQMIDKYVPCAVCVSKRTALVMIPGRDRCYGGWTAEYNGYLVSDAHNHGSSEYVCLDSSPEALDRGQQQNLNGRLFYFAEVQCGSLRCPPYVHGRELTCVVCSR